MSSIKSISELACEAPTKWERRFGELVVKAAVFDPENKNKVLLMLSEECWSYDLKNKNLTQKIFTHDQNKTDFIRQNSPRPKQVDPYTYTLGYGDKYTGADITSLVMLGNMVTVYDTATKAPLYTIEHEKGIKFAMFNSDQTKLITVSHDNQVKVSKIKKPITLECDGTSIACNPYMARTSQFINNHINFSGSDKSSSFELEGVSAKDLNQIIRLMALVYKKKIDQIKKLLSNLDSNSLCSLVQPCDFLQITNNNIHLTDIIYEYIVHKYDPKRDQHCIKQLPFCYENIIAIYLVKNCINSIDNNKKPSLSIYIGNNVDSVTFSPDGKTVATGSWNKTAKIWDAQTGECLHTLTGHTLSIRSVAISSDGERVVTGSFDDTAKIWDAKTGKQLRTLTGHTSSVTSVAISSNGKRIVTGSFDNTAKIWNAQTGECLHTLTGHTGWIYSVAISSDGKRVVTGSEDKTAKVWNTKIGRYLLTLAGHTGWVISVAISSDGKTIVTGSIDNTAKIWNAKTGKCLHTLTGHAAWICSVAISSDGESIVTGSDDRTVKIWDAKTGKCLLTLAGHTAFVRSIALSSNGKKVVTGSDDKTVKIWDIDQTEKWELLNKLTIEQTDLLTEKIWPVIKTGKVFELKPKPEANSKEYDIFMNSLPNMQKYLRYHVKVIMSEHLPNFFNGPFINKIWLWTGLPIGSFVAAAVTLFCYYKYFKRIAKS